MDKKSKLFYTLYCITGSVQESEDILQDIDILRWKNEQKGNELHPGYYYKAGINRALNAKKKIEVRKRDYPGPYLPEPFVFNDATIDINFGVLFLLERLKPVEQAVFVLKEVFSYPHHEICQLLDITASSSRTILSRANKKLKLTAPPHQKVEMEKLDTILKCIQSGDLEGLIRFFHKEIKLYSDGGGKVSAALNAIAGYTNVVQFLNGISKTIADPKLTFEWVSNSPGIIVRDNKGKLDSITVFDIGNAMSVNNIYIIRNPDKIKHIV